MAITLTDDGTMDTVLRCDECGEEFRFNWDGAPSDDDNADELAALKDANPTFSENALREVLDEMLYDEWVDSCIAEIEAEHECHSEDDEPQDGDITTEDHRTFYQDGRKVLAIGTDETSWYARNSGTSRTYSGGQMTLLGTFGDDHIAAIRAYMERVQYWPNVWSISDHGNAQRMDLSGK